MQAEMARPPAISRPITQSPAASTRWSAPGRAAWGWRPSRGVLLAAAAAALLAGTIAVLAGGRRAGAVIGAAQAVIIVASYTWNWAWTGFAGKQLWDWLHLMLFPVAVVRVARVGAQRRAVRAAPRGHRHDRARRLRRPARRRISLGLDVDGFTGNSFHDWLDLMIAPFLVPLTARLVHAYHTSGRAARRATSR